MVQASPALPDPAKTSAEEYLKALLQQQGITCILLQPYRGGVIEAPERWRISEALTIPVKCLLPIKGSLAQATENELNRHIKDHGPDSSITLHGIYLTSWVEFEVAPTA
jgi:hypothetical protein